ncbi:protease B nonderepressible form [Paecilomyces lecythidis]|uniref:Protein PBN1 n=1 Tax=Paecilomyces lecythidis TaxID=3004212 RepID=A0ABR3YBT4_9EURO
MKRRITFAQGADSAFEQDQVQLTKDALKLRGLDAAREERVTFGFNELPSELWIVLKQSHELHIRWASERPFDAIPPFSSRVAPGLHVFFTPVDSQRLTEGLCPLLKKAFSDELKCTLPEISFTTPPLISQRFASVASYQFYSVLPSISELVTYIQQTLCPSSDVECRNTAASLLSADYVDIDYDRISHALSVSAYWAKSPEGKGWTTEVKKSELGSEKIEVGLLSSQPATEPEELSVGGLLAVVGEDDRPQATMFSFPSRHHPLPKAADYAVSFLHPTGLHPTMKIAIPRSSLSAPPAPADATCALHSYLTLPSPIFADKYQLSTTDRLFLESHNLAALRTISGEADLEAPDWVTSRWGSNLLLELATPAETDSAKEDWEVTVPLHLRYLKPSPSGNRTVSVPWPVVFWACTAEEGTKMGVNPFDRVNLGWEGLFGPKTMFYQLSPSPSKDPTSAIQPRLVEQLDVPVLEIKEGLQGIIQARAIEIGTGIVVLLGFLWALWKLALVARPPAKQKDETIKSGKKDK